MSVITLTKAGAKATTTAKLSKEVFAVEVKSHELIRLAYEGFNADERENLAVTKTRGLVRGGGRKPWKQKGTGRARFGSIRNPIWKGGGIVFGPTGTENYTTKLNKKAKVEALRQALTLKNQASTLAVIESLPDTGKTSELAKLVAKLNVKGAVVLVDLNLSSELKRAAGNLEGVSVYSAGFLNVRRTIDASMLVLTKSAVEALETRLGGTK